MIRTLKIYVKLVGISIQSQLQYRKSVAMQAVGHFLLFAIEFSAIAALFMRFGSIGGWTFREVVILAGFADMSIALADAVSRGFDLLGEQIRRGDFDRILVRPVSSFVHTMGQELTLRRFGRFTLGAIVFAFGITGSALDGGAVGITAIALGGIGAVVTFVSAFAIQGAMSFGSVESLEAMNIFIYGGRQVAAYPMSAYRGFVRDVFIYIVPIGCSIYMPVCALLGREPFPGIPPWIGILTPLAAIPFAAAAGIAWKAGIARYESAGG